MQTLSAQSVVLPGTWLEMQELSPPPENYQIRIWILKRSPGASIYAGKFEKHCWKQSQLGVILSILVADFVHPLLPSHSVLFRMCLVSSTVRTLATFVPGLFHMQIQGWCPFLYAFLPWMMVQLVTLIWLLTKTLMAVIFNKTWSGIIQTAMELKHVKY